MTYINACSTVHLYFVYYFACIQNDVQYYIYMTSLKGNNVQESTVWIHRHSSDMNESRRIDGVPCLLKASPRSLLLQDCPKSPSFELAPEHRMSFCWFQPEQLQRLRIRLGSQERLA